MSDKEIVFLGLGKMGKNAVLNMLSKGYKVYAYNRSEEPRKEVEAKGAVVSDDPIKLLNMVKGKRIVWLMLPAGEITNEFSRKILPELHEGDIVVDGSNAFYKNSIELYNMFKSKGVEYVDAGCSGGPSGARNGMSIMVGGEKNTFDKLAGLFKDVSVPDGYKYIGPAGSGHFVKMVHNAIEYGMMESIAEGIDLISSGPYKDSVNLKDISEVWTHGSVIRGYLMDLTLNMLSKDEKLKEISPFVEDTGEGRWAVQTAAEFSVPFNAITNALYERYESRQDYRMGKRVLAGLRNEFGQHGFKKA